MMLDPMEVDDNDDTNVNADVDIDDKNVDNEDDDDDIDPIDGGPKYMPQQPVVLQKIMSPLTPVSSPPQGAAAPTLVPLLSMINNNNAAANSSSNNATQSQLSKEEEARLAIDMLRNEDVASRVAAAHRLDAVALVLGEERTRNVSNTTSILYIDEWREYITGHFLYGISRSFFFSLMFHRSRI
jgi:hypothetical protein